MEGNPFDRIDAFDDPDGRAIVFRPLEDHGVEILDTIERRRYPVETTAPVELEPVSPARFRAPVDAAVRCETSQLTLPTTESLTVRTEDGAPIHQSAFEESKTFPSGTYLLDLTTVLKLYLRVDAALTVATDTGRTVIECREPTTIEIGARSFHRRPESTITTTTELDDLRRAVEGLSSALKTTSPERSFPTLRGHPPMLEFGDEFAVSEQLHRPETGIRIEINRSLRDLCLVAPLAFYLGAELAWGNRVLRTEHGRSYSLADGVDLQTGVERLLKRTLVLDCLTRTEGLYPVALAERERFESDMDRDIDFAALYEQSPATRLETYQSVPFESVAPLVPTWSQVTYVEPTPTAIGHLPFLLDTLSLIRTDGHRSLESVISEYTRADPTTRRSKAASGSPAPDADPYRVLPETTGALTTAWVGDGSPIGAMKAIRAGFRNRLERDYSTETLEVLVVCNDTEMAAERDAVDTIYGDASDPPLETTRRFDVTTGELRSILERETDFLHFIGHVDADGFRCPDGWLDAADVERIGASAFLLNSCTSYEQGVQLIERGAIAGVVTIVDIIDHQAALIGKTFASFLQHGFPLYAPLSVVRDAYSLGASYVVLGNGHLTLTQPATEPPEYLEVTERVDDRLTVTHHTFVNAENTGIGSFICPPYETDRWQLLGGPIKTLDLASDQVEAILDRPMPLLRDAMLVESLEPD